MAQISERMRESLKKPLGKVVSFSEAREMLRGRKIVAVGDEIVFNFLEQGELPFVAVFDLKTLRRPVGKKIKQKLMESYPKPEETEKEAGELNQEMFLVAKRLLEKGGGLYVKGEEDLFALPFAMIIRDEALVYGQPGEGCVIVERGEFEKEKLEAIVKEMGINVCP
ncbi:DUF359 domain-containing protein [Candidatus Micrarchaeota archaeon]|nr:DUF359 domain-containing protein [Candidatus Micrarchaeota archaeon]MBD3417484.1 DUF359 domain-containing protein [Candidatus Micrarchaeota archaeon]